MQQIGRPHPNTAPVTKFCDVQLVPHGTEHSLAVALLFVLTVPLLLLPVLGSGSFSWVPRSPGLFCVGFAIFAVGCGAIYMIRIRGVRRQFLRFVRERVHGEIESILHEIAKGVAGSDPTWQVRTVAHEFALAGRTNETLRFFSSKQPRFDAPYEVHFGPTLLNETDSGFQSLESMRFDALGNITVKEPVQRVGGWLTSPLKRNFTLAGGAVVLLTLIPQLAVSMFTLSTGSTPWHALLAFAIFVLLVLLILRFRDAPQTVQRFVVPGGLVTRRAKRGESASVVSIFDRRLSALCLCSSEGGRWTCLVSDREKSEMFYVTERESIVLLRAWLSPLAPPSPEKLIDLT